MEPVCSLKRPRSPNLACCIICQEETKQTVLKCTDQGILSLQQASSARTKLQDVKNRAVIERLTYILYLEPRPPIFWHKSCYASYTSKTKISRLQKASKFSNNSEESASSTKQSTLLRSSAESINWNECMFCQDSSTKSKLYAVCTFETSEKLLEASKYDKVTRVRFAGVSDLIAAEGKYHLACYVTFQRSTRKTGEHSDDIPMEWLVAELEEAAHKAHVFELPEVWERYQVLAGNAQFEIPPSYISRRYTFKTKIEERTKHVYEFISLPGRHTVLIPLTFAKVPLSKLLEAESNFSPIQKHQQSDEFLEMVHVAFKLRSDNLAQPKYKGFVVNEEEMISCVPESLFIFLRLIFGGQELFDCVTDETSEQETEEMTCTESKSQKRILSVAQDLMYNVSGGTHWTPKHLGLASTLHQATRSKELVQLFHNAGHTLSYLNINQVDTALAESTLKAMDPEIY